MKVIFDIETDGLLDEVSKIHCLSYTDVVSGESSTITDYNEMIDFLDACDTIIGHNIIRYDIPVIKKILDWASKIEFLYFFESFIPDSFSII